MGFPRQEYWSGWPFPSPGDLLNPRTEPASTALQGGFFTIEPPEKSQDLLTLTQYQRRQLGAWVRCWEGLMRQGYFSLDSDIQENLT